MGQSRQRGGSSALLTMNEAAAASMVRWCGEAGPGKWQVELQAKSDGLQATAFVHKSEQIPTRHNNL